MPRLEKMGLEGDLGALISMQIFGELKCDDKWYYHEDPKSDRHTACEMPTVKSRKNQFLQEYISTVKIATKQMVTKDQFKCD